MRNMQRVQIMLDKPTLVALKQYRAAGQSASWVIREAMKKYIHFTPPQVTPENFEGVDIQVDIQDVAYEEDIHYE
jgi:hypothetical protein